ncbi:MAG: hypothetical protein ACPGVT_11230 [Maricaulaceae bacterium]
MRLKLLALSASALSLAACSSGYGDYYGGYGVQQSYGTYGGCGSQTVVTVTTVSPCGGVSQTASVYNTGPTTLGAYAPYGVAAMAAPATYTAQTITTPAYANYYAMPQYQAVATPTYVDCCDTPDLRYGLEFGVGTDFDIGGNIFPGEKTTKVGGVTLSPIKYKEAWKQAITIDGAVTYDLDHDTTVLGRLGYSKADGQQGVIGKSGVHNVMAEFSDLEQFTLEGGVRQYLGSNAHNPYRTTRPYVSITGGFTYTDDVYSRMWVDDSSKPLPAAEQYVYDGWTPTVATFIGAEKQIGPSAAIAVETGVRWSDNLETNYISEDRISIPVRLRGRFSF